MFQKKFSNGIITFEGRIMKGSYFKKGKAISASSELIFAPLITNNLTNSKLSLLVAL